MGETMTQRKLQTVTTRLEFASVAHVAGRLNLPASSSKGALTATEESQDLAMAQQGCLRGIRFALAMQAGVAVTISALIYAWAHR
jgi:hypothetical protein